MAQDGWPGSMERLQGFLTEQDEAHVSVAQWALGRGLLHSELFTMMYAPAASNTSSRSDSNPYLVCHFQYGGRSSC